MSGKIEIDIKINHEGEVNRYVSGNSMIIVVCVFYGRVSAYCATLCVYPIVQVFAHHVEVLSPVGSN